MKINSITRLIIMSAMTCFSTAALADVTPHSNTDSVDFAANMTVQGTQCSFDVSLATGSDVSFTYDYHPTGPEDETLGTMTPDSTGPVKVAITSSCSLKNGFTARIDTANAGIARSQPAIRTNNGGVIPFYIGVSNITFFEGGDLTGIQYHGRMGGLDLPAAYSGDEPAAGNDPVYANPNPDPAWSASWGFVQPPANIPGVSSVPAGYMIQGDPDNKYYSVRNGILGYGSGAANGVMLYTININPCVNCSGPVEQVPGDVRSATLEFATVVAQAPYSIVTKQPDPQTAYDTQGTAQPITGVSTLLVTPL